MLKSGLCDYCDAYTLVSGRITIIGFGEEADDITKGTDERDKEVVFKNCAPFTKCISKINNTQVDDAQKTDAVYQYIP